jgi:hypothetical protein
MGDKIARRHTVSTSRRWLFLFVCVIVLVSTIYIVKVVVDKGRTTEVLFIGNSYVYVNDMPSILEQLSVSTKDSKPIHCSTATVGGATLEMFWNDPKTHQILKSRKWDIVVLQEQSTRPITDPALFSKYGGLLANEIKSTGAKPYLYMTWARKDTPDTQDILTRGYRDLGTKYGCTVAPVGEAWRTVRKQYPSYEIFESDGSHPNPEGAYLTACVFYGAISGKSPIGLTNKANTTNGSINLDKQVALYLQTTAGDAVDREKALGKAK